MFTDFEQSLQENTPLENLNPLLQVLWYDAKGDWTKAHAIAQDIKSKEGSLLHAYLHRVEGDDRNAGYWYNRAGEPKFTGSLMEEWEYLVKRFVT